MKLTEIFGMNNQSDFRERLKNLRQIAVSKPNEKHRVAGNLPIPGKGACPNAVCVGTGKLGGEASLAQATSENLPGDSKRESRKRGAFSLDRV